MSKKTIILWISIFAFSFILSIFTFKYFPSLTQLLNYSITNKLSPSSPLPLLSSTVNLPKFNLDTIFSPNHSFIDKLPQNKIITIITTGDVIPARTVNFKITQYNDFTHPFLKTADFLRTADLTLINLEAPLIKDCPVTQEGMVFCGNQRFIEGLKFAGIDAVNLANNHTLNYGVEGISQTIELLNNNRILTNSFPPNQLTTTEIKGKKFGFLGWNFLENFDEDSVLTTIKEVNKQVDFLIVSCHWGAEYESLPALSTQALAHKMIEAGADFIVGNHPHWIQSLEIYQEKLIIYAHGNFIFDQEWSQETKNGFVAKTTYYQGKIVDLEILPVYISDYNQPEFILGPQKEEILQNIFNLSLELQKEN